MTAHYSGSTQLLNFFQHVQFKILFQKLIDLDFATISISDNYEGPEFNYAQINYPLVGDQLVELETHFKKYKKSPAVYFEHSDAFLVFENLVKSSGYTKTWEDAWLFYGLDDVSKDGFNNVKKVDSTSDLDLFMETFKGSFQLGDPQNPFGELNDYLDILSKSWKRLRGSNKLEYFMVLDKGKPVAVSSLTNFGTVGYISNIGTLKEYRSEGAGQVASLYAVFKSIMNKNSVHCLATSENGYPYELYKKLGFIHQFSAVGYSKSH